MDAMILHRALARRTRELAARVIGPKAQQPLVRPAAAWQRATLGLFALSMLGNAVQTARIDRLEDQRREAAEQLEQAQYARDYALEKLGAAVLQAEADRQARAEQAAAYEAVGTYQYVGECTVTAYCPCAACCGQWADGLTATGLPAGPGIAAVDPEVIPLGSTVVIDGQKYLAADTGVTGLHVDICAASHQEAESFGVQTAQVWMETEGEQHG